MTLPDKDITAFLIKAVASLSASGATLRIPAGDHIVGGGQPFRLIFSNLHGLRVDGGGAILRFTHPMSALIFNGCTGLEISGLTLTWADPFLLRGTITKSDVSGLNVSLSMEDEPNGSAPIQVRSIGVEKSDGKALQWDVVNGRQVSRVTRVGASTLTLAFLRPQALPVGTRCVIRREVQGLHAVTLQNCKDVAIAGVTIWSAPGMALTASASDNISISGVHVVPEPGAGRLTSSNADAIHLECCNGNITVEDCIFSGMGDDALNITSRYVAIALESQFSARCLPWHGDQLPDWTIPARGSAVTVVDGDSLRSIGKNRVIEAIGGSEWRLRFEQPIEEGSNKLLIFPQERAAKKVIVRKCKFLGNRSRGIVSHDNITIESNVFVGQGAEAILLGADLYWLEGPVASHVLIANNDISYYGSSLGAAAGITVSAWLGFPPQRHEVGPSIVNCTIEVSRNDVSNSDYPAIAIGLSTKIIIKQNKVRSLAQVAFFLNHVERCAVEDNISDIPREIRLNGAGEGTFVRGNRNLVLT